MSSHRIQASEVTAIKVTEEMYKASPEMADSVEQLQERVDAMIAQRPADRGDSFTETRYETVYLRGGVKGFAVFEDTYAGEATLSYSDDHIDDISWGYEKLGQRVLAGPAGDFVSQAESVRSLQDEISQI